MSDVRQFIRSLNDEVISHPALHHSFLDTIATRPLSKRAWRAFATQLYPHVHFFIPYMEELLLNTFEMNAKLVLAKVLLDEYGEDAEGASHPDLFRRFVRATGGAEADAALLDSPLDPATIHLVEEHMRLCRDEHYLVGIGAIGQAHEFAIAYLFPPIVAGLRLSGFSEHDIEFFILHTAHDVEHSRLLEEAMEKLVRTPEDRERLRRGTLASLAERHALWTAMERRMLAVEAGADSPTSDATLLTLTARYRNVPDTFWPT